MSDLRIAWLTACLIALTFLAMLGAAELLSQALGPVSIALMEG